MIVSRSLCRAAVSILQKEGESVENIKTIGVCYTGFGAEYQSKIINRFLSKALEIPELRLLFFTCISDGYSSTAFDKGETAIFKLINYSKLDALVVLGETIRNPQLLESIIEGAKKNGVPVISFDVKIDGCYNVIFDDALAVYNMVTHIAKHHGCRKINFLTGNYDQDISVRRTAAYKNALEDCGIEYEEERVSEGNWWYNFSRNAVKKWLDSGMEIDAIVCANDAMSMAACDELKSHGLKVPDDVVVTGIDNLVEGQYHFPQISTARIKHDEGADKMLEIIMDLVNGKQPDDTYILGSDMIFTESCGCEKATNGDINEYHRMLIQENDNNNIFNKQMCRANSRIVKAPDEQSAINELKKIVFRAWAKKMWICVDEHFFDPEKETVSSGDEIGFSERMEVIAFKNDDEIGENCVFDTSELVPDLEKEFDECRAITFLPLHANDEIIGYIAKENSNINSESQWFSYALNITNALVAVKQQSCLRNMIAKLEDMYIRDSMTKLYNRRGFFKKLSEMFESSDVKNYMVASIDIDNLKYINDKFGHNEGDYAINTVAKALEFISENGEICARFGGDEFIVACSYQGDGYRSSYEKRFNNYLDYFNEHTTKPYEVKASFGMVVDELSEIDGIDNLIKIADERMYARKSSNATHYRTR